MLKLHRITSSLGLAAATVLLTGTSVAHAATGAVPAQKTDPQFHARLPQSVQAVGKLVSVNNGSFPPYSIVTGPNALEGASGDFSVALGQLLGIAVVHESVSGLSSLLGGIKGHRYDVSISPVGDFPDREAAVDFIDYAQEFVVFAVPRGNPNAITSLESTCGRIVAVMAAGSAEKVMKAQEIACRAAGKPAVKVLAFSDQPTAILAVRSKRADALFSSQAALSYFVQQSSGELELAGKHQDNGFHDLYQGAVVAKDSPLGPLLVDAFQRLLDNGTYAAIMKKWGLGDNAIPRIGLNLSGKGAK